MRRDRFGHVLSYNQAMSSRRLVVLSLLASLALLGACDKPASATPKSYHATGQVRSFGPQKAFVNIAHDDIPGYMKAMTMSFEPEKPAMLDGIDVGARVSFDFYETADSRRVLSAIQKVNAP